MKHEQFLKDLKEGSIKVYIHKKNAEVMLKNGYFEKRYFFAISFYEWLQFLLIPLSIYLSFWIKWWIGLAILFFLFMPLGEAIKKSMHEFVLKQAIEDEQFYEIALELLVLEIKPVIDTSKKLNEAISD